MKHFLKKDNEDIIAQIKKGNKAVLELLYQEQREPFFRFLRKKYSVPEGMILDIYQESILAFYNNILRGKLDTYTGQISSYLFAIGKNIWLTQFRKQTREPSFTAKFEDETQAESILLLEAEVLSEVPSELLAVVKTVVENMTEPCASILKLALVHDLPAKEIVAQLGYKNKDVLYTQKNRCLKKVQGTINKQYNKEDF